MAGLLFAEIPIEGTDISLKRPRLYPHWPSIFCYNTSIHYIYSAGHHFEGPKTLPLNPWHHYSPHSNRSSFWDDHNSIRNESYAWFVFLVWCGPLEGLCCSSWCCISYGHKESPPILDFWGQFGSFSYSPLHGGGGSVRLRQIPYFSRKIEMGGIFSIFCIFFNIMHQGFISILINQTQFWKQ